MILKIKKILSLFLCTILLVTNISISVLRPLEVNATEAVVEFGAIEGAKLLAWLIATGLVSIGAYEIYENEDYLNEVIDTYITNNSCGTLHPVFEYDETTGNTYLSGTDITINEYYSALKDWDWTPHWGDDVIEFPPWDDTPTQVKNPYTGEWENVGSFDVLFPWEQDLYGIDKPIVFPWDTEAIGKLQDWWQNHTPDDYENAKKNSSGGGGGGDSGDSNNKNKWTDLLKNFNPDTVAKFGGGLILSISSFMDKLTSGETGNETIDSWVNEDLVSNPVYTGYTDTSSYEMCVTLENLKGEKLVCSSSVIIENGVVRPYGYINSSGALDVYYLVYNYSDDGTLLYSNVYSPSFSGLYYYPSGTVSNWYGTLKGLYIQPYYSGGSTIKCNFPLFYNGVGFEAFKTTGDDSACINKEEPQKLVWADMNTLANNLPSTLGSLSSLPEGKALKATALKDYVDDMTAYKQSATPADLSDPETQTSVATQTAQQAVEKNTVDAKTDTEEKEENKPIFVPPTTTSIDIDGSEATRDWRLVFPFCIPFDMIDLYKVLIAEPKAPYWEIPLRVDAIGFEYTFIIDFEQFETLAEIFRLCETIGFILGLALITGKVIKW